MSLMPIGAGQVLQNLARFSAVIDARSEDEYALDHLPGAINWPTLNNAQRIEVGTLYKQVNPFQARKCGAAMAARNIASHIERELQQASRDWEPLLYCWRGGQRSGALGLVLSSIGFKVHVIEGGYKAWRAAMLQDMARVVARLRFKVVCGPTGSGKTRLLSAIQAQGGQVIDLEELAAHRSSVLGAVPGRTQPSQKHFDTLIYDKLGAMDPARVVYVESESKKVGNVAIPTELVSAMRQSDCVNIALDDASRIALLLQDYRFLTENVDYFCDRLATLTPLKGASLVGQWQAQARQGAFADVVLDLLVGHYDPAYRASMARNFPQYLTSGVLRPTDHSMAAMTTLAGQLLASESDQP